MTVDYNGVAVIIAAVAAAFASIGTTIMQWRASKKTEANKQEAIVARAAQTDTIIASAVTPALLAPPPVPPPTDEDKP